MSLKVNVTKLYEFKENLVETKVLYRYRNPVTHCIYVIYVNANVPNTYDEAINCNKSNEWRKAMNSVIKSLEKKDTWQIIDKSKDRKIIHVKWIYKKKSDNTYKARLFVRGFNERNILLLSYCRKNNFFIDQIAVGTAFWNRYVKAEVYVNEPKGL